ncbi:MAG: hypothetical protein IKH45_02410 [Neisseriaceae bacterium]|nr:hypothetical protein [Neisseriaceae bacterium]
MNMQKLSAVAIIALQEALTYAYWYKSELKSFLLRVLSDNLIVSRLDWNTSKRDTVIELVRYLEKQHNGTEELLHLCNAICELTDFSHLLKEENGVQKAQNAKRAIEQLRTLITPRQEEIEKEKIRKKNRVESEKQKQEFKNTKQILEDIRQKFLELSNDKSDPQKRGYELEPIMNKLFELEDLNPKSSFKTTGEQIDGAFVLENTHYLFEAKWHSKPIEKIELVSFADKVKGKLKTTLGLFLSINGFSQDSLTAFQQRQEPSVILMDGADLMAVLDQRISLSKLISRKKEIASTKGKIFANIQEILSSK